MASSSSDGPREGIGDLRTAAPSAGGHAGQFVLIHGDDVVDCFGTYDDAIKAGYQQFGLDPFLVKLVNLAPFPVFPPNRIIREGRDPVAKLTKRDVLTAIDEADSSLAAGAGQVLTAASVQALAEDVKRRGRRRLRDLFM